MQLFINALRAKTDDSFVFFLLTYKPYGLYLKNHSVTFIHVQASYGKLIKDMKNTILISVLLLLCAGAQAFTGSKDISYLKTRDTVYFGQDLKIGLFNSKIISADGSTVKISNRDITGYLHDSQIFDYLPVIIESNEILCYTMMQLITARSGLSLYRYNCYDENNIKSSYFVFKDSKFYLRIDQRNALSVLPFFGIKNIKISES